MSVNEQVLVMVAMAVAIIAILTVGTLVAADILPLRLRRGAPARPGEDDTPSPV